MYIKITMEKLLSELNALDSKDEISLEPLFIKVETLLKTIKEDMVTEFQRKQSSFSYIAEHQDDIFNSYESFYVTSRDRLDSLKSVISYLLLVARSFLYLIKSGNDEMVKNGKLTPLFFNNLSAEYAEFVKNIHFLAELPAEHDVMKSIQKAYHLQKPKTPLSDIEDHVRQYVKTFKKMAPSETNTNPKNYIRLIESLQYMVLFWFELKDGRIDLIRKSDIYIYQLCRVLLEG